MGISVRQLTGEIGAEVSGLDLSALSKHDEEALYSAFLEYGLLMIRGLDVTTSQHVDFSRVFGIPELHPIAGIRHPQEPMIIVLDNGGITVDAADPTADDIVGAIPWHSDLTYMKSPSRGAVLRAIVVPEEGGQTGWIDTARVYAALPVYLKRRVRDLRLVHSFDPSQARYRKAASKSDTAGDLPEIPEFPPVEHPLVHRHAETGELVLNISPLFSRFIPDLPDEEASRLYDELVDFATQEEFAYIHDWQPGDMIIWDNWRTMHKAFGCKRKHARVMHRTTLSAAG
jgi:taurine dioxygenase